MNYIDGRFGVPDPAEGVLEIFSPADLDDFVGAHPFSAGEVERAVAAARRAQPAWAARPEEERAAAVRALGREIEKRGEELARLIAREVGKALWESRGEVRAMVQRAEATVTRGLELVKRYEVPGVGECRYRPHGVLAVLGPFNFPGHLPNGHIMPALATGNAVVFKPSEVAPGVGELYARCVDAAGLPPGVFNLVQGGPEVGARLAAADVNGVLFTGSWAGGRAVEAAAARRPGVMVALEMGGKNAALVLEDADLDKAAHDVAYSAYATAGQRCTAASRAIVHARLLDAFVERVAHAARRLRVGHPLDEGVFMGPLATARGLDKFLRAVESGEREGAEPVVAAARGFQGAGNARRGHYLTPSLHRIHARRAASFYQREELFGPDLAVYEAASLEEAVALANDSDYGLVASVHTKDPAKFEWCFARLEVGGCNWNAPTVGTTGLLPFGGLKKSGNHRPASVFASLYCTYPAAIHRGEDALDPARHIPGIELR